MLFATFNHHIPRSASLIENSGASDDGAISITKNPAGELALKRDRSAVCPDGFAHVKVSLDWHGRCLTRQRRIGKRQRRISSQRWDVQTGLPPSVRIL
jgi:hypothetical protein